MLCCDLVDEEVTDLIDVDDSITDFVCTLCTDFIVDTDFDSAVMFIDCSTRLSALSFALATSIIERSVPVPKGGRVRKKDRK